MRTVSAVGIADNVQMFGDGSTHDIYDAVERSWKACIKLHFDKCTLSQNPVVSLETYTLEGVKPDPKKNSSN